MVVANYTVYAEEHYEGIEMTAVEEITLRLGEPVTQMLINDVDRAFSGIRNKEERVRIFIDTETGCDFLVQIWNDDARKSKAGLELASHLKNLGIVNHVVWKLRRGSSGPYESGELGT